MINSVCQKQNGAFLFLQEKQMTINSSTDFWLQFVLFVYFTISVHRLIITIPEPDNLCISI